MRLDVRVLATCLLLATPVSLDAQGTSIPNALSEASSFDDEYGFGRMSEGNYVISARRGLSRWLYYNGLVAAGSRLAVTVTHRGGPTNVGYGFTFARASRDVSSWCTFEINANGQYRLVRWGGSAAIQWRSSASLRRGFGARNELAVELRGRTVMLYANGVLLDTWAADRDLSGYIGLEINQGVEVRYESYSVAPVGAAAAAVDDGKTAPGPAPVAGGADIIFVEDFSGEREETDEFGTVSPRDGGLWISATQGMVNWYWARGVVPSRARITVTVEHRGGPTGMAYGVAFGRPSRDQRTWMRFDINSDGYHRLETYGGSDAITPTRSGAVRTGAGSVNQLTVDVRGSSIVLYVNGQQVGTYTTSRDAAGYVGLAVSQGVQVLFRNLTVQRLP